MSIPAMQNVLAQMRLTAAQSGMAAGARPAAAEASTVAKGFGAELKKSLEGVSQAQNQADAQAAAFQRGDPGVALNDVMVDLQKAGVAFQGVVAVRNKVVAAYEQIMNLPA